MSLTGNALERRKRLFELCMREEVDEVRDLLDSLSGLPEDERNEVLNFKNEDEVCRRILIRRNPSRHVQMSVLSRDSILLPISSVYLVWILSTPCGG